MHTTVNPVVVIVWAGNHDTTGYKISIGIVNIPQILHRRYND